MSVVGKPAQYMPRTMADDLQRRLRRSLFDGGFEPGQTISIRRIAEEHEVSVIPARDALRGLVAEGVLAFRDSRTIVVPELDEERLRDILFARTSLEGELADRAFARLDPGDLSALRTIDARLDEAIAQNDTRAYVGGNHAFHFYIYDRAGSVAILRLVETLWLQYAPSMCRVCAICGASGIVHDYHRAALRALDGGDRDGFSAAIVADIRQGMEFISRARITVT